MSGNLFWITGLSGSGKTTFAKLLKKKLEKNKIPNVYLDGDILRRILEIDKVFDRSSRLSVAYKYSRLCHFFVSQNINVIISTISLFNEIHKWNREKIKNYCEILVVKDLKKLMKSNKKKIYTNSRGEKKKNVVGLDIKPEFPKNPDFLIESKNSLLSNYYKKKIDEIFKIVKK